MRFPRAPRCQQVFGLKWLSAAVLLAAACAPSQLPQPGREDGAAGGAVAELRVVVGAEVLLEEPPAWLAQERVALLSNRGATVREAAGPRPLHEALAERANLVKLLAPEHGVDLDVEAGGEVTNDDAAGRIPVRSWYGADAAEREADLADVDVLLFDLPDVGSRWFTYIGTMRLAMEAAAATGTRFVVLDRPNPLGGEVVEGWITEPDQRSLVASLPVPIRHGMTVGELARMVVAEGWMERADELELEVVPMRGWQRSMLWPETGLDWAAPSPNLPTFDAALVYAGTCLIEATTLNEGRGTEESFLQFGAPDLEADALIGWLEAQGVLAGLSASTTRLTQVHHSLPAWAAPKPCT